jgi:16S rRNA processing protein RimM
VIEVGRLLRTRGRSGEFIAEIYSTQHGRAETFRDITLSRDGHQRVVAVENLWYHDGRPVFKFSGIDSISDAEPWEGAAMLVADAERLRPEQDEYVHADLIGCTVESSGRTIGVVQSVEDYGGPALLRLVSADGKDLLIPFARAICKEIDVAAKRIRVDLPEGLAEL